MPTRFDINIELFAVPGIETPDAKIVQTRLERAVADFWPALGLPAEPVVSVQTAAAPFDLFDFSLALAGKHMPVPVFDPEMPATDIVFRIMTAIFANRSSLANDEQLRELRLRCLAGKQNSAASWRSAPHTVWQAMAALLLQNGFSLRHLPNCFENWDASRSVETAFEQLVGNLEMLRLRLVVHPELAKAHSETDPGWETRFAAFYPEIYQELGIIVPQVVVETDAALPMPQFRLQLNDLLLPVQPGLSPNQVLYENPTADHAFLLPDRNVRLALNPPENDLQQAPAVAGPWAYILHWTEYWVRQCAGWYVNTELLDAQMDNFEENNRALLVMIREQWPTTRLCGIIRHLLAEQVSIQNLTEVLDVLLRIDGPLAIDDTEFMPYFPPVSQVVVVAPGTAIADLSASQLAGQVRSNLKYPIVFPHMKNGVLPCYTFDQALLRDFREGFFEGTVPYPGSVFQRLLQQLYAQTKADFPNPVFLVPSGIRAAVMASLRPYFPAITVLGHAEIPAFFIPSVKASITLP